MQAITTRLVGGLGNQMFQYAAGRALSLRTGLPLMLDITHLSSKSFRDYELSAFNIQARTFRRPGEGRPDRLTRWAHALGLHHPAPDPAPVHTEPHYHYDHAFETLDRACVLDGYWQTERYFLGVADVIRQEFRPRKMPARVAYLEANLSQPNAISVHIRRGDYASNPEVARFHGLCDLSYYKATMDRLAEHVANPVFHIFSDDHNWIQAHFPKQHPWVLVEDWPGKDAWVDMWLMSRCGHHIIANSSYSWWGAWLNPSTDKQVIAPAKWFNDAPHDTRDILPTGWLTQP